MGHVRKLALCCASLALIFIPAATTWAAPFKGAAHLSAQTTEKWGKAAGQRQSQSAVSGLPRVVRFREEEGRGLLVRAWVNGAGPYTFAIDTGAGATLISRRVATEARVPLSGNRSVRVGGLSGAGTVAGFEATIRDLAVGDEQNTLASKELVIVMDRLAPGVDGVLDPVEAYWPLGFEIDMLRGEMSAFDPRQTPLRRGAILQADETIVPWLTDGGSRRPFVMLEGGRRALLDTGSGFGLAVTQDAARSLGIIPGRGRERDGVQDLAGGRINAHRISPATIRISSLVLRGIPTDLLPNVGANAPILLGRDALRPFRLTFDSINRLIRIRPS